MNPAVAADVTAATVSSKSLPKQVAGRKHCHVSSIALDAKKTGLKAETGKIHTPFQGQYISAMGRITKNSNIRITTAQSTTSCPYISPCFQVLRDLPTSENSYGSSTINLNNVNNIGLILADQSASLF